MIEQPQTGSTARGNEGSASRIILATDDDARRVRFPDNAKPERSPVYAFNEIDLDVSPERLWPWLLRAVRWPEWYANARDVEIDGGGEDLALGSRFSWTTFGVRVHTIIEEFVPNERLAWSGKGLGSAAYHGWVIARRPDGGSHVITEETQRGFVASAGRWMLRGGLHKWHQRWLEGLGTVSQSAMSG